MLTIADFANIKCGDDVPLSSWLAHLEHCRGSAHPVVGFRAHICWMECPLCHRISPHPRPGARKTSLPDCLHHLKHRIWNGGLAKALACPLEWRKGLFARSMRD